MDGSFLIEGKKGCSYFVAHRVDKWENRTFVNKFRNVMCCL